MRQFTSAILNTSGLRETLREKVRQIDRLESLDGLRDLRLTRADFREEKAVCELHYEGTATEDTYPHVRTYLINEGVVNKNNVMTHRPQNKGQPDEYVSVSMHLQASGGFITIRLKTYHPEYKG